MKKIYFPATTSVMLLPFFVFSSSEKHPLLFFVILKILCKWRNGFNFKDLLRVNQGNVLSASPKKTND